MISESNRRSEKTLLLIAAACFLSGSFITVAEVISRKTVGINIPGSIEITTLFIALGALLSLPVTFAHDHHIKAKLISEVLPANVCRLLELLGSVLSVLLISVFTYALLDYLVEKVHSPEVMPDTGLSLYGLYIVVFLSILLSLFAAFYDLHKKIRNALASREQQHG